MRNNITYHKEGDYLIPNLVMPKKIQITKLKNMEE